MQAALGNPPHPEQICRSTTVRHQHPGPASARTRPAARAVLLENVASAEQSSHVAQLEQTFSSSQDALDLERMWNASCESSAGPLTPSRRAADQGPRHSSDTAASRRQRRAKRQGCAVLPRSAAADPKTQLPEDSWLSLDDTEVVRHAMTAMVQGRRTQRMSGHANNAISMFLADLGDTSILSKGLEQRLLDIFQRGRRLEALLARAKSSAQHAAKQAALLGHDTRQQVLQNSTDAKALLLQHNLRLVFDVARKLTTAGVPLEDRVQMGVKGFERAIERFDTSRGFKLSTYAVWWIRQAVLRGGQAESEVVSPPAYIHEWQSRISKTRDALEQDHGREATLEEIARELGVSAVRVARYMSVRRNRDLDGPAWPSDSADGDRAGDKARTLADTLQAPDDDDEPEEELDRQQKIEHIMDEVLDTLPSRERNVLRLRYGMHTHDLSGSMSQKEIAIAYGLTKERVRQIESIALRQLRRKSTRLLQVQHDLAPLML